jgi:hypothetical protein
MTVRLGAVKISVEVETSWSRWWVAVAVAAHLAAPVVGVVVETLTA